MKKLIIIFLAIIIIFPSVIPLFNEGFFTVHDNTQVERVFQMTKSISDGHFPVRWVSDLGYGYGYPIFNFYAPLPYYLGAFLNLLFNSSLLSTKIMFFLGTILSFFTMFLFASKITNTRGGLVAAVIYLYFPYHAVNIYIRGAVGEFYAYAFMPLVFMGLYIIYKDLEKKTNIKNILVKALVFSIPVCLVIISHNLSAFMMGVVLIPYFLLLFIFTGRKKQFVYSVSIMFFAGVLLSAFYLLPAVLESGFTNVSSQIGGGAFYPDHFVCLSQLWHSEWGYGGSIKGCIDGISFSLGKFNLIIILTALILSVIKYKEKLKLEVTFWLLLVFSIFLLLPYSRPIWDTLPFMEYLQYPWRFLNFTGLFIAILSGFLIYKIKDKTLASFIAVIIIVGQLYFNYKLFKPVDTVNLNDTYYENIEHVRKSTSRISDEYMPPGFSKPKDDESIVKSLVNNENVRVVEDKSNYAKLAAEDSGGRILINKAFFPSWTAFVNGQKTELREEKNGVSILLLPGKSEIELKFLQTPVQIAGNLVSLISFIILVAVIIIKRKK